MKADVGRSSRPKARGKKHRATRLYPRLLPRSDFDLAHDEDWLNANHSLAVARYLWDRHENLLSRVLRKAVEKGWLIQADSWALLELFRDGKPAKDGRPPASPDAQYVDRTMASYSHVLQLSENLKTEAAVAATAELYGVRRSTVFAARRREKIPQETWDMWRRDPGWYVALYQGIVEVVGKSK